jgi:hypothetical protein
MKQPSPYAHKVYLVAVKDLVVPPALVTQREFRKAKADRIAAKFDPNKIGVLTVNKRGNRWLVLDGQHRLAAAIQNGIESLLCEVYEELTDQQMADLFCGLNERTPVAPLDRFFIGCTANYDRETAIRRVVEANGQRVSHRRDEGISTIGALGNVYDRAGEVVLGQVIRTINLGFGGDPLGFDRSVVEGLGLLYNRFNGKTNEKHLAQRLSNLKQGARELLRKGAAIRERTGNQMKHCVAAAIVDVYNKGEGPTNSKSRLPDWWKETA